ncbi:MAG: metallophosphoesterase [Bacteroidia bacterium]|nr:metallophosphoesterase [Bacteroidia bacterium]
MIWFLLWGQQLFLVGDAGALTPRQVRLYERFWLTHARKGDVLLWLGDNLYPAGHRDRPGDRRRWARLVSVSRSFPGTVIATPGNHDWKAGLAGILRQERDLRHLPTPGSSQAETISIGRWHFLFIDSELYIQSGGKDFSWRRLDSLTHAFSSSDTLFFVLHHPPRTAGAHGGYFPLSAHIFPLRIIHPALYVPLPGLGSLFIFLRKATHHPTDLSYPAYKALADSLINRAKQLPYTVIFVSGHDHNLQIHRLSEKSWAIVSGSGCKTEPLSKRRTLWGKAVVGLWKLSSHEIEAYALRQPTVPIWRFAETAVP